MLLILVPIAWLAVVTLVVAVCQATALGEAGGAPGEERAYRVRKGLVVWDRDCAIALRYAGNRPHSAAPTRRSKRGRRSASGERAAVHGVH